MRSLNLLWHKMKLTFKDLSKGPSDLAIPKKWNCCDELVVPNDLAKHYKEKHLNESGPTLKEFTDLIFDFVYLFSVMIVSGSK